MYNAHYFYYYSVAYLYARTKVGGKSSITEQSKAKRIRRCDAKQSKAGAARLG